MQKLSQAGTAEHPGFSNSNSEPALLCRSLTLLLQELCSLSCAHRLQMFLSQLLLALLLGLLLLLPAVWRPTMQSSTPSQNLYRFVGVQTTPDFPQARTSPSESLDFPEVRDTMSGTEARNNA